MKNLKQDVIDNGWIDIQDEFIGTITIDNEEKGLDHHTVMVVKTWGSIRKWLSENHII